ncbi:MAG: aspartyl/glutamyl-tRNA amidotransferase subunit A [Chloroflexi bacterium 13_1_40CM_4_68_4]|nr:MAG: aspartyl/glutamyl-tRNA amidotransferase subunit A [Chloroflexi bacterium 13_1_40CM_4_68_4]
MKLPATAHEAAGLLRRREVSSLELTEAYLERIGALDERIGAFLVLDQAGARRAARAADERLASGRADSLTGIPWACKDVISTQGIETTAGSRILKGYLPPFDATVAARLSNAGAVMLGKTNCDEFAMGSSNENSAYGPVHNPADLSRVPGGSSGGSAAAVASEMALFALGTDTGGSVRQPASLCGVVGLRPSYGRVSRYGVVAFSSSQDQVGPLTWDVHDCALVLNAIAGDDPMDSTTMDFSGEDFARELGQGIDGMRFGVPKEYVVTGTEPAVEAAIHSAVREVERLGGTIEEVSLPLTDVALAVYYVISPAECSANLARYDGVRYGPRIVGADAIETYRRTRGAGFGPEVKRRIMLGTYALSAGYYDAYYKKAQQVRTLIKKEFDEVLERVDFLLTPTSPTVAFPLGAKTADPLAMYLSDVDTLPVNIAGLPAISVPCGLSRGLPIGLQIIGRAFDEARLLRVAHAYEQATPHHQWRPPLEGTAA